MTYLGSADPYLTFQEVTNQAHILKNTLFVSVNLCYCEQRFHQKLKLLRGRTCLNGLQWKCPPVHKRQHQDGPARFQAARDLITFEPKPQQKNDKRLLRLVSKQDAI